LTRGGALKSGQEPYFDEEDRQWQKLGSPSQVPRDQMGYPQAHEPVEEDGQESAIERGLIWHG